MFRALAIATLLCVCAVPPALAQDKKPEKTEKEELQLVVDIDGKLQVVPAKGLKELKKRLDKEHKEAVKEHAAAKKEAKKNKEKFTDPKPKKPSIKVMSKKPQTAAECEELMAKIIEERRKAEEKKAKK